MVEVGPIYLLNVYTCRTLLSCLCGEQQLQLANNVQIRLKLREYILLFIGGFDQNHAMSGFWNESS